MSALHLTRITLSLITVSRTNAVTPRELRWGPVRALQHSGGSITPSFMTRVALSHPKLLKPPLSRTLLSLHLPILTWTMLRPLLFSLRKEDQGSARMTFVLAMFCQSFSRVDLDVKCGMQQLRFLRARSAHPFTYRGKETHPAIQGTRSQQRLIQQTGQNPPGSRSAPVFRWNNFICS